MAPLLRIVALYSLCTTALATVPCKSPYRRYTATNMLTSMRGTCDELINSEELNSIFCSGYQQIHEWAWHLCAGDLKSHRCDDACDSYISGTAPASPLDAWMDPMNVPNVTDASIDTPASPTDPIPIPIDEPRAQDAERQPCTDRECVFDTFCAGGVGHDAKPSTCAIASDVHHSIGGVCESQADSRVLCQLHHDAMSALLACGEPIDAIEPCDRLCGREGPPREGTPIDEIHIDEGMVCEAFAIDRDGSGDARGPRTADITFGAAGGTAAAAIGLVAGLAAIRRRRRLEAQRDKPCETTLNPML